MSKKPRKNKTSPAFGKIERQSMHDQVYLELKQALMEAKFEPGERLSLRNLAEMFGVSVIPVRVALLRLMAEKAVDQATTTTGHFNVPKLGKSEFEEIVYLRALLEGEAAEKAAGQINTSTVSSLQKMAEQLLAASNENHATKYLRLNRDFKFAVIESAKSPVLQQLIESLWIRIGPVMHYYAKDIKQQQHADHYFAITKALKNHDGETARKAMVEDVRQGATFLREVVEFD